MIHLAVTFQNEPWGRLVYDPEVDEFEAHTFDGISEARITRPISVGCLITGQCDLGCRFCYGNQESLPKEELSANEWALVFERLRSWGAMRVDLSGGEPTLRHDLKDIIDAALATGLNVVVSTNGRRLSRVGPSGLPAVRWHVSLDSGLPTIHETSRALKTLQPSDGGFEKTSEFIRKCHDQNLRVRVLTCIGHHNSSQLFALGEHIAQLGVDEWNVSRILRAGRAQTNYEQQFFVDDEFVLEQVQDLRTAFPFIRIRYSNRTEQDGYFLLVLPDGSLATQYTDPRDKVVLGKVLEMSLSELQTSPAFRMEEHGRKWVLANLEWQVFHPHVDPKVWDLVHQESLPNPN